MPRTFSKVPATLSADEIAEKASRGEDISTHFTNKFTVVRPVRRVNVDLTEGMLRELDARAARLNISRQAVIKTLLGRALNEERPQSACAAPPKPSNLEIECPPKSSPLFLRLE
jgi:plasmid stability protein